MNDFYLFANCNFVPDKYADWQSAYEDLAKYVFASEPTTKTYYFGIPIDYSHDFDKTTSMFAFEVYGNREDLYETHLNSSAMTKFLEIIPQASTTGLDLNHYRCITGFLDLSGNQQEAEVMQDMRITCLNPSSRSKIITSLNTIVNNIHDQENENGGKSGVLTYMAFASLDDEVGLRVFGRWNSRDDLERFVRREDIVGFWMENKEMMKGMEQHLYLPNGKGWLHRGNDYAGYVHQSNAGL
ncbi:hypothetical protein P280DRAFT_547559 [Massarina eburnea CBS 473.64]|uniref:ABM domain-containing protein n=1 Tax=Massarina eburnea CBS 473.64 TaxID=1395130 RepID=A0A6A6S744_9PLEO|nr:hypothetical protein P280DRAFT_547559 [Massarina eburnea CBS 473.64]